MARRPTAYAATLLVLLCAAVFACKRNSGAHATADTPAAQASAPRPDDAIRAVYQSQESAIRKGDGALWLSLQTSKLPDGVSEAEAKTMQAHILAHFSAHPGWHCSVIASGVRGDHGAIIGQVGDSANNSSQYETARFVVEDGAWKIAEEDFSDSPIDPRVLNVLLPPPDGAFTRAHSPWTTVTYADANTKFFQPDELEWKMQATRDESYLYVRFESKAPLPAPETEINGDGRGGPSSPPIMKIKVIRAGDQSATGETEFEFQADHVITTRATFDEKGHANSNRFFVIYSLARDHARTDIFNTNTDDTFSHLVDAQDHYLAVKIPLKVLGLDESHPARIEIEEVNSLAKILPYRVGQFSGGEDLKI